MEKWLKIDYHRPRWSNMCGYLIWSHGTYQRDTMAASLPNWKHAMIEKNPHNSILGIEMADSINQLFCGQIIHWEYGQNIIIISHHRSSLWGPTFGKRATMGSEPLAKLIWICSLTDYIAFCLVISNKVLTTPMSKNILNKLQFLVGW